MTTTPQPVESGNAITFKDVKKSYGHLVVLDGISQTVRRGEAVILCGPSGSGKSTLIRTINRLETIDSGSVLVGETDIADDSIDINKLRLKIGFVFQQYNLFPHLSALDNVALGLRRLLGVAKDEAEAKARDYLVRVGLGHRAMNLPKKLSGGEQQRVAIARALVMEPSVLLLDEPTSALDPMMAADVRALVASLVHQNITILCVTHDLRFAREIADRIWMLDGGRVIEAAAPEAFFASANPRVRSFVSA
jgi:polar amino acid transport system ATP-binding protein